MRRVRPRRIDVDHVRGDAGIGLISWRGVGCGGDGHKELMLTTWGVLVSGLILLRGLG